MGWHDFSHNVGLFPNCPIIAICHRTAKTPVRYVMRALLAVASDAARRRVAGIEVHSNRQNQILHGGNHYADLGAADHRIVSQVPVHDRLKGGNILAHKKKTQVVFS